MKKVLSITFITAFGVLPLFGSAQQFSLPAPLALRANPSSPSPGETILVEASTPTFDRNSAFFDWVVDGKPRSELSGFGKNTITLSAGNAGSVARVEVSVLRKENQELRASLAIPVSQLALVWFAETSVPRWYRGKALPVPTSVTDVTAVPTIVVNGRKLPPQELIYRWSLDSQKDLLVGVGEEVFRFKTGDLPRTSHLVAVVVEDIDKKIRKEGKIFVVTAAPRAAAYALTPLGGVEPRAALSLFATKKRGVLDFLAESFFFPVKSKRELRYQWSVEGTSAQGTPENPSLLTLDTGRWPRGGETTNVPFSLTVDDLNQLVPAAAKSFTVQLQP